MKDKYSAFTHLESAISAIESAQQLEKERAAALAKLEADISRKTAEFNDLHLKTEDLKVKYNNMANGYSKASTEMDEAYNAARSKRASEAKLAEKELQQYKSMISSEMEVLANEKKHLEETISGLQKKLSDIRASLNI